MSVLHIINRHNDNEAQRDVAPISRSEDRWQRNELQDTQRAIELLFEFKKELNKLHPVATDFIAASLKSNY